MSGFNGQHKYTVKGEFTMPTYKMIFRDAENPNTSDLHIIEDFCEAKTREEARQIFEDRHGVKYVVAGPIKVEE
jgi:NADH:ubiquinone oxidoreductase subunit B-like Fe-S oxidoreductase